MSNRDYILQRMEDYEIEVKVWQFVNTYLNECYSFQIYTVIDEMDEDELQTIIDNVL